VASCLHQDSLLSKAFPARRLLQLRVLRLGFPQDGDVGVGVFPESDEASLQQAHAFEQINVAWVEAERIHLLKGLDISQSP
jgi:hypothetical protein